MKGAGTVIASDDAMGIVDAGNAGMASGGMGDVLSGIIGALLGQKLPFMMQPVRAAWPTVRRLTGWLLVTERAVCWPPIFLHAAACC